MRTEDCQAQQGLLQESEVRRTDLAQVDSAKSIWQKIALEVEALSRDYQEAINCRDPSNPAVELPWEVAARTKVRFADACKFAEMVPIFAAGLLGWGYSNDMVSKC